MSELAQKTCIPCEGGVPPLARREAEALLAQIPEWRLALDGRRITREYTFTNFQEAMDFANRITPIAEKEGHHPDLSISWGKVVVSLTTHAIGGLSENDFILAAKINAIS